MTIQFKFIATGQSLIHHDLRSIVDDRLEAIKAIIRGADASFTNFEMTVFGRHAGWPLKGSYFSCAKPEVLDALKDIGFSILSLSNNHAFDLGPSGVLSTIEEASRRGFLHAGIGKDERRASKAASASFAEKNVSLVSMDAGPGPAFMYADNAGAHRPARPGLNGLRVERKFDVDEDTFALLQDVKNRFGVAHLELANYAQPNDPVPTTAAEMDFFGTIFRKASSNVRRIKFEPGSAITQLSAIRRSKAKGEFVIAYLHHHHWEPDWCQVPGWVEEFAHLCVDNGASIFVCHGAPVLQGVEIYRRAPIFYGLGNFLFHTSHGETEWSPREVWKSVIASCTFNASNEIETIDFHPIVVGGAEALESHGHGRLQFPVLASGHLAEEIFDDLAERSEAFGTFIDRDRPIARYQRAT
ncbi:CapA family protein [Rhizobium sp. BK376]|uniref:CapA family protein n=1 Tax=Rhizobium sp. BK376 TaxID=2512149 RepID=UPI00104A5F5F|nr:CapA family protein [Rhizobium sp. BK376]TCR74072.1 poly-gamma-glutamate synthesis protein (capsule biosynthesis protein) [Rhizobium sp. BK376]